jgi:hypothetical protein
MIGRVQESETNSEIMVPPMPEPPRPVITIFWMFFVSHFILFEIY